MPQIISQLTDFSAALYANLHDQSKGSPLLRLLTSAKELEEIKPNAKTAKVRQLAKLAAIDYAGFGSLDESDYQLLDDSEHTIDFDRVVLVPYAHDRIEQALTEIGNSGFESAEINEAGDAIRDKTVQDMLKDISTAPGVKEANPVGSFSPSVMKKAAQEMDKEKIPRTNRFAVIDASQSWELWDDSVKLNLQSRAVENHIRRGTIHGNVPEGGYIGELFSFHTYITTLTHNDGCSTPHYLNTFMHLSAWLAKLKNQTQLVRVIPALKGIGDYVQVYQGWGGTVADGNRVYVAPVEV